MNLIKLGGPMKKLGPRYFFGVIGTQSITPLILVLWPRCVIGPDVPNGIQCSANNRELKEPAKKTFDIPKHPDHRHCDREAKNRSSYIFYLFHAGPIISGAWRPNSNG